MAAIAAMPLTRVVVSAWAQAVIIQPWLPSCLWTQGLQANVTQTCLFLLVARTCLAAQGWCSYSAAARDSTAWQSVAVRLHISRGKLHVHKRPVLTIPFHPDIRQDAGSNTYRVWN